MGSLARAALAMMLLFTTSTGGYAQPLAKGAADMFRPPACLDTTPHRRTHVRVDKGVWLEVLDWGGADKPRTMVLLTGLGDNAHVFDQFAYQFTDFFHVIGITRRGFLPSSQPAEDSPQAAFDVDARARDDIAVLDALGIRKAVFVGHSVAGSELSALGTNHGSRVDSLVYLDAFDLSKRFQLPDLPGVPYTEADGRSLQLLIAAGQRLEDTLRPAQAVCFGLRFDRRGAITDSTTPPWVSQAILRGVQEPASSPTDWARIKVPRLGIFNQPSVEGRMTFYPYLSAEDKKLFDGNWPAIVEWYTDRIDEFAAERAGTPKPVVYTLPDAPHYFYLNNNQAFVVLAMREFLLGSVGP